MHEFRGNLKGVNIDFESGRILATFEIINSEDFKTAHESIKNEMLDIKVGKHREKRSLDANSYSWVLMTKLASHNAVRSSKEEVYEKMLKLYGQPLLDEDGNPVRIIVRDDVDVSKFGIHTKAIGHSYANGAKFIQYMVIKGSSEYDTKEMSVFIDGIVSECKELGIQTITPRELQEMKERWGV